MYIIITHIRIPIFRKSPRTYSFGLCYSQLKINNIQKFSLKMRFNKQQQSIQDPIPVSGLTFILLYSNQAFKNLDNKYS